MPDSTSPSSASKLASYSTTISTSTATTHVLREHGCITLSSSPPQPFPSLVLPLYFLHAPSWQAATDELALLFTDSDSSTATAQIQVHTGT
jgi:hypothetical protein